MKRKNEDFERSQISTPLLAFMDLYNRSLPAGFPRASVKILKQFQETHLTLFKENKEWSVYKHRKKLMDWLSSHHDNF